MAVTGESQLRKLLMRSLIEVQMLRQSIKQVGHMLCHPRSTQKLTIGTCFVYNKQMFCF